MGLNARLMYATYTTDDDLIYYVQNGGYFRSKCAKIGFIDFLNKLYKVFKKNIRRIYFVAWISLKVKYISF